MIVGLLGAWASPPQDDPSWGPDPSRWFPSNYQQSRETFRAACMADISSGGFCRAWKVPSQTDQDLTIDYGLFSRHGDRLLVLQSGIHGIEAPSGAAVQLYFMNSWLNAMLDRGIDVLVIHAINPWGFKYERRNDEGNINLNRSFSVDGSAYRYGNAPYRRFRRIFEPSGSVQSLFWSSARSTLRLLGGFIDAGFRGGLLVARLDAAPLNEGLNNGQYEFPDGINYGGTAPRPQAMFLRQQIGPIIARRYRKTLYLDFHTGIGESGAMVIILGNTPAVGPRAELQRVIGPTGIKIFDASTSVGFKADYGDVIDYVPALSSEPKSILAATIEFGTLATDPINQLRSVNRMILENEKYRFGCATAAVCGMIDSNMRETFNPSDIVWRRQVMRGAEVLFRALLSEF
jgi:Protein of unknown function (DUF2817)